MLDIKATCINNASFSIDEENKYEFRDNHLLIGKKYDVLEMEVLDFVNPSECYYLIKNEEGKQFWYSSRRFNEK